jgi:hypothetical protein
VSYITRLREQSGLTIVNHPAVKNPDLSPEMPDSMAAATELLEVVETREVASESASTAVDIVSLSPAAAAKAETPTTRRHDPEPTRHHSDSEPGEPSITHRSSGAEETLESRPSEEPDIASSRRPDPPTTAPLSREATLRHVFEWLAAPAQPEPREGAVSPRSEPVRGTLVAPSPSMETGVPLKSPSAQDRGRVLDRVLPASPVDVTHEEVVELSNVSRRSHPTSVARDPEPAAQEPVEEIVTVSIGAIHMRVEAQAAAPVVAARPADPVRPVRPERRERSRLPRHYLRP